MDYRFAELADIPALAEAHAQLQRDEKDPGRASPSEIEKLFWKWLGGEHRVVLFERGRRLAAYALYLPNEGSTIELLQFFVRRDLRGTSVGRDAFQLLRDEVWPPQAGVEIEVDWNDAAALEFWKSLGFGEKRLTLGLPGESAPT